MTPYSSAGATAEGAGASTIIPRSAVGSLDLPRPTSLVKRTIDLVGSLVLLIGLLPVIAVVALAVAVTSRGPMIFGHTRVGQDGEPFACWKFRTMVEDAEERLHAILMADPAKAAEFAENHKLKDDPRITPIGALLRRTSLDELPQLYNVLVGQMSLIGPRPVVPEELPRYGEHAGHYLAVRPGVSGPWQVGGRSDTTFEERVAMDVEYVEGLSTWGDVRLLARTVVAVLRRVGAH